MKLKRPELEADYVGILQIFENLDKARKTVESANGCKDPSDAVYYRDGLDTLVRLEAQVDALTVAFQKTREELKEWLADMAVYYARLEKGK